MPELRLQSDMLRNMSLAQRRAMMQRGMIWQNQQIGAFEGEEYYGGRTNPYQRYYAQMPARQIAFQQARFLNAQKFQNSYMLQQQKAMDIQFAKEQEVTRTRKERERKLSILNKEIDAIKNNPELDQNSFEVRNMVKQLQAGVLEIETELEINPVDIQKIQSDYLDKDGKPIETQVYYQPDGKAVIFQNAKEIAAQQLEKDKFEQAKIHDAREANYKEKVLEQTIFKNETDRLDKRNKKNENDLKAAGLDVDPETEAMKTFGQDAHDELMRKRKNKVKDFLEMDGKLEGQTTEEKDEAVQQFIDDDQFEGPTKQEQRDEAIKMWERTQPIPQDRLQEEAMYESPMDPGMEPEFSDEQFAGTEPAGLYDPTGQPLPMDGGMYNGFA